MLEKWVNLSINASSAEEVCVAVIRLPLRDNNSQWQMPLYGAANYAHTCAPPMRYCHVLCNESLKQTVLEYYSIFSLQSSTFTPKHFAFCKNTGTVKRLFFT